MIGGRSATSVRASRTTARTSSTKDTATTCTNPLDPDKDTRPGGLCQEIIGPSWGRYGIGIGKAHCSRKAVVKVVFLKVGRLAPRQTMRVCRQHLKAIQAWATRNNVAVVSEPLKEARPESKSPGLRQGRCREGGVQTMVRSRPLPRP